MSKRIQLIAVLLAWFLATGAQWDLVQTFGWARMVAKYAQSMSVADAVKKTFSGEEMCGVCEVVKDAKQQDDGTSVPLSGKSEGKILLLLNPTAEFFVGVIEPKTWSRSDPHVMSVGRAAPPLQPPRA